jgi:hypothetical protein
LQRQSASGVTSRTIIYASNAYEAKMLGEAQYSQGNILNWTELPE